LQSLVLLGYIGSITENPDDVHGVIRSIEAHGIRWPSALGLVTFKHSVTSFVADLEAVNKHTDKMIAMKLIAVYDSLINPTIIKSEDIREIITFVKEFNRPLIVSALNKIESVHLLEIEKEIRSLQDYLRTHPSGHRIRTATFTIKHNRLSQLRKLYLELF